MSLPSSLETLLDQLAVWKGNNLDTGSCDGTSTGFPVLDACLPGRGWPRAGLIELLSDHAGIGEVSLLLPAMARLSQDRGVLLIAPPFVPYAPALDQAGIDLSRLLIINACSGRDALACAEQALRSGGCGAVLLWSAGLPANGPETLSPLALRRLHLAALRGNAMGIAFRSAVHASQASPAPLRILLRRTPDGLRILLFKRRSMTGEVQLLLDPYVEALRWEVALPPISPSSPVPMAAHSSSRTIVGGDLLGRQESTPEAKQALLPAQ